MPRYRGFAVMPPDQVREISRKGGLASQANGNGHRWDADAAREAGRKGGAAKHRALRKKKKRKKAAE